MPACAALVVLVLAPAARGQTFVLNDFNNAGFTGFTGGFAEQRGPFAARLFADIDGQGSAAANLPSITNLADYFNPANNGTLDVRYNPRPGHRTDFVTVDLFDTANRAARFHVDTTLPPPSGAFGFYESTLNLSSPVSLAPGFDPSAVRGYRVGGPTGAAGPFNVNLWNLELNASLPVDYPGRAPDAL